MSTARPSVVRARAPAGRPPAPGAAAASPSGREQRPAGSPRAAAAPAGSARPGGPPRTSSSRPAPGDRPSAERLRVRAGVLDVPPAHPADVAVRAGPGAPPVGAAPVQLVVQAAARRRRWPSWTPRTSRSPAADEHLVGDQVAVGVDVVVGHRHLAAPDAAGELGALLDDQRVRGDVVRARADRRVQRGPPVVVGLARGAVDQVQVDVVEARPPAPPRRRPRGGRACACGPGSSGRAAGRSACRRRSG